MERDWVVSPKSLLRRAVLNNMISIEESNDPKFVAAANNVCEELREDWPEDDGFGSSDFVFLLQGFVQAAGGKAEFVGDHLTRIRDAV